MSSPIVIDLFVEDHAHEEFLKAVLHRLAREEGKSILVRVRSARGGHGRVLTEFSLYQKSVLKAPGDMTMPDLLVIAIDANCKRFNDARKDIEATIETPFRTRAIVACPDPTSNDGTSPIQPRLPKSWVSGQRWAERSASGTTIR
jgi:hypothetical protein